MRSRSPGNPEYQSQYLRNQRSTSPKPPISGLGRQRPASPALNVSEPRFSYVDTERNSITETAERDRLRGEDQMRNYIQDYRPLRMDLSGGRNGAPDRVGTTEVKQVPLLAPSRAPLDQQHSHRGGRLYEDRPEPTDAALPRYRFAKKYEQVQHRDASNENQQLSDWVLQRMKNNSSFSRKLETIDN